MAELNYDGTSIGVSSGLKSSDVRLNLERSDIRPEIPEAGGTVLALQVNARDDRRDPSSPEFGALTLEAQQQTVNQAEAFFNTIFEGLNDAEKADVAILVVASDASLIMPGGITSPHQRAYETAEKVIEGIEVSMGAHGVATGQLLNKAPERVGKPVPVPGLVDLEMWKKPEFVEYMKNLWGRELWSKYEGNWEPEMSLNQGIDVPQEVETPAQIAIRVRAALTDLTVNFAADYHEQHPNGRLIIWTTAMYDNISPWLKGYVYNADPGRLFTPIEKGGGLTIKISPDGKSATTQIGSEVFQVPSLLKRPVVAQNHAETE